MACQRDEFLNPVDPELTYEQCISLGLQTDECGNCQGQELKYVELWDECYDIENTAELELANNSALTGEIPPEIGNLTNLTYLNLNGNQFTELPSEIGNLTNLTWLGLDFNQLTELPLEIGNLVNLTYLSLYNNHVREIPSEIGSLVNLTHLYLYGNQLTEIPPEIGSLESLISLRLSVNQLTELPAEFCGIYSNLDYFYISNNSICGEVPSCLEGVDIGDQNCP
jgi:Leucine-rich repeat (LRR) protein